MRCPQCGLVHAESDQYCRRCNLDLRTGIPRPPVAAPGAATAAPALESLLAVVRPWLSKIAPRRRSAGPRVRTEPQPFPAPVSEAAAPEPEPAAPPPVPLPTEAPAQPSIPTPAASRPRPTPAAAPSPFRPREPSAPKAPGLVARLGNNCANPRNGSPPDCRRAGPKWRTSPASAAPRKCGSSGSRFTGRAGRSR